MVNARLLRVARMAGTVAIAMLAVAGIVHGIAWWQATEALSRETGRWIAARAAEGFTVRHAAAARGGWPTKARLTLPDVVADGVVQVAGQGSMPLQLGTRAITIEIALLRPREARVAVLSPFSVSAGPEIRLSGEADSLEAVVPLSGGADAVSRVVARRIVVRTDGDRFSADRLELNARRDLSARGEAPALMLALAATGVQLPASAAAPLGNRVGRAELDVQVIGQVPGFGTPRAQAIAWRDSGGFVQVPRLLLDWGPLSLAADATLALDQAVQPSGAGRARLAGLGQTLETLATAGIIPRQTAQAGRSIIAFMQRTPAGGGPPVVELPLTLQDRTLSAGRFTLLRLPPIAWPP